MPFSFKTDQVPTDTRKSLDCISDFGNAGPARVTENIFTLVIWKRILHLEENTKTLLLKVWSEDNQYRLSLGAG